MNIKKVLLTGIGLCMLWVSQPSMAIAQWNIGGSYEIRQEEPKNGFGARISKGILNKLPVVDLRLRAHFSYFDEKNQVSRTEGGVTYSYAREVTDYDFGLAAVAGVSVGLVKPYAGLGLGSNTLDINRSDFNQQNPPFEEEQSDNNLYWNGFVGAEVSPVPFVKPFVEYRFQDVNDYQNLGENLRESNGRLIFGVLLSF